MKCKRPSVSKSRHDRRLHKQLVRYTTLTRTEKQSSLLFRLQTVSSVNPKFKVGVFIILQNTYWKVPTTVAYRHCLYNWEVLVPTCVSFQARTPLSQVGQHNPAPAAVRSVFIPAPPNIHIHMKEYVIGAVIAPVRTRVVLEINK